MTARTLVLLIAAAALLPPAAGAADAKAGTYVVNSCRTPDGQPASTDGWSWSATEPSLTGYSAACPGGGITLRLLPGNVHDIDATANMRFSAPSYTEIVRYRVWRSVRLTAAERYFFSPTETLPGGSEEWALDRCGGLSNTCTAVGSPGRTPTAPATCSTARRPTRSRSGASTSPAAATERTTPTAERPRRSRPRRRSGARRRRCSTTTGRPSRRRPPAACSTAARSPASSASRRSRPTRAAGSRATSLEVDGQVVTSATLGDNAGSCREPYTTRVPCPTTASGHARARHRAARRRPHRLRVLATDAAGNTSAWGPATIVTDNAQALCAPSPTPAGTPLRLSSWVEPEPRPRKPEGKPKRKAKNGEKRRRAGGCATAGATAAAARRRSVTVAMGRATVVSGELTDAAGAPVAGAAVCVSARVGDGGALTPLARLTTDAGGRFAARVPAGTSRQLWSVVRVAGGAVTAKAIVRVRARLSLKPARRSLRAGKVLRMRGRLAGRPIPGGGVLVNIQAKRGREW